MKENSKKLPMKKPLIYCYTVYGLFFSVIEESDMDWVCHNFIQIMYHDDWQMPVYEIHTDLLYHCPFLKCTTQLFEGDEESLVNAIIGGIDEECYCCLFLDWLYVNEEHKGGTFAHTAVIAGYDKESETFDIYDNFDKGRFVLKRVSFHNTAKAFFSASGASVGNINDNDMSSRFDYLKILSFVCYRKTSFLPIDPTTYLTRIDTYLKGKRNYANTEKKVNVYGINVYDMIKKKLEDRNHNLTRDFHFLYEHKILMNTVLKKLYDKGVFKEKDRQQLKEYENIVKAHLNIRNQYIKDHVIKRPNTEDVLTIQKKLAMLRDREVKCLEMLLNSSRILLKVDDRITGNKNVEFAYRPSIYNVKREDDKGNLIIANTLRGTVKKYHRDSKKMILELLKKDVIKYKNAYVNELVEKGFIVSSDVNEKVLADQKFYKTIYDNSFLNLMIAPTDACNMRCIYCYEPHTPHFMDDEKVVSLKKYLRKAIRNVKMVNITWFGGEPLLRVDIIYDVMSLLQELCKFYKIPLTSGIVTNGYLLDRDAFEKLYLCGVRNFQITIDGFKESHDHYRPLATNEGSYDRIISNMRYILGTNKRVDVLIRMNVPNTEAGERIRFIDYLKGEFLSDSRFRLSVVNIRDYGGEGVQTIDCIEFDGIDSIIEHCFKSGINPVGNTELNINNVCCEHSSINSFYINHDLTLYKCSDVIYSEFRECGKVGIIDGDGRAMLDETKLAHWMEKSLHRPACENCDYYPLCYSHHCPYDIKYRKKRGCTDFKTNIDYLIKYRVYEEEPIRIVDTDSNSEDNTLNNICNC